MTKPRSQQTKNKQFSLVNWCVSRTLNLFVLEDVQKRIRFFTATGALVTGRLWGFSLAAGCLQYVSDGVISPTMTKTCRLSEMRSFRIGLPCCWSVSTNGRSDVNLPNKIKTKPNLFAVSIDRYSPVKEDIQVPFSCVEYNIVSCNQTGQNANLTVDNSWHLAPRRRRKNCGWCLTSRKAG